MTFQNYQNELRFDFFLVFSSTFFLSLEEDKAKETKPFDEIEYCFHLYIILEMTRAYEINTTTRIKEREW